MILQVGFNFRARASKEWGKVCLALLLMLLEVNEENFSNFPDRARLLVPALLMNLDI